MTRPPTNPDDLPTGPLRKPRSMAWALLAALLLAALGYYYFAGRATGRDVGSDDVQSGRGLPPPPTAPSTTP